MKDQKSTYDKVLIFILSFFYTGYLPKAPGTFGSIATLPFMYLLSISQLNFYIFFSAVALLTILACVATEQLQKKMSLHDPQWIVFDEVLGMLTAWLFIYPSLNIYEGAAILLFFRIFDIVKVWPASFFDKLHHGSGTILDDIVSGIYAGLIIYIGKFFLF